MTDQNNAAHDLGTSSGGRSYIAEYFATQLRRHDFARYIENTLAADFACALARHLSKLRAEGVQAGEPVADSMIVRVDAAMVEMKNIHPPLRRSDCERLIRATLASAPVADQALGNGRNMFYEGLFDGETEHQRDARLRWANDMRAAFERHTGNGWFDKDWHRETGIWAAAWKAATADSAPVPGKARPTDWQNALRIAELPEVDEALANFCDDSTLDNAVGLVLAVLCAARQASEAVRNADLERDTGKDRLSFHIWALVRGMDITLNDSCGYRSPLTQRAWMRWNPPEPAAPGVQADGGRHA